MCRFPTQDAKIHVNWVELPSVATVGAEGTVFRTAPAATSPGEREMHGTCCHEGKMYISGGRNENGEILSDVWELSIVAAAAPSILTKPSGSASLPIVPSTVLTESSSPKLDATPTTAISTEPVGADTSTNANISASVGGTTASTLAPGSIIGLDLNTGFAASVGGGAIDTGAAVVQPSILRDVAASNSGDGTGFSGVTLQWKRCAAMQLPSPRCSHGAAVIVKPPAVGKAESSDGIANTSAHMVLVGGFTGSGFSEEVICGPLPTTHSSPSSATWKSLKLSTQIGGRIGLTVCGISPALVASISDNKKYACLLSKQAKKLVADMTARAAAGTSTSNSTSANSSCEAAVATENIEKEVLDSNNKNNNNGSSSCAGAAAGIVLYGGVSPAQDHGDIWLLLF